MSASCYKIVPNRHVFLDFMITLDLSPEQRHCVETFPIRYVEVDEARNTWKIFYDAAATALEQQELAAAAKKLAAACSVAQVAFVNVHADQVAAPCLEDEEVPLPPEPEEPPEEEQAQDDFFQSEEYLRALEAVEASRGGGKRTDGVVFGRKITKRPGPWRKWWKKRTMWWWKAPWWGSKCGNCGPAP